MTSVRLTAGKNEPPTWFPVLPWMLALALTYRVLLSIAGCYFTARLAPSRPMVHALILGAIGVLASAAGIPMAMSQNLSPVWYPVSLAILSLPCAWIGGKLADRPR